jgi:CheY-like chemotaxis protein
VGTIVPRKAWRVTRELAIRLPGQLINVLVDSFQGFRYNARAGGVAEPAAVSSVEQSREGDSVMNEGRQKTVLVVEDQVDIRDLETAILQDMGYRVVSLERAEQVVDTARREQVALIILDLFLPGKRGEEVLVELRRDVDLARVPIVVVSAYLDQLSPVPPDLVHITKPFELDEFERIVRAAGG